MLRESECQQGGLIELPLAFPQRVKRHRNDGVELLSFKPGITHCPQHEIAQGTHEALIPTIFEPLNELTDAPLIATAWHNHREMPTLPLAVRTLKNSLHRMGADRTVMLLRWQNGGLTQLAEREIRVN